jgi:hypothetical protein
MENALRAETLRGMTIWAAFLISKKRKGVLKWENGLIL